MESPPEESPPPVTLTPCNQGCRFAEPLRGDYSEWIWCARPGAAVRVRHNGSDCAWFEARHPLGDILAG